MVLFLVIVPAVAAILATVSSNLWADAPQPAVQEIVRAHRIEVVDAGGTLLAVLGTLTDRFNQTSTGLALVSNEKHVLRLAMRSFNDGSLDSAKLNIVDPEDMKESMLFEAGVTHYTHGVGLVPELQLNDRESKYMMKVDPNSLGVAVHIDNLSYASALSLRAEKDHSATLSLGGLFKPFKVRAIAEADKPRFEVEWPI